MKPAIQDQCAGRDLGDRDLFEYAPVSMWLEDWSGVQARINQWHAEGISDLAAHAASAAEILEDLIRMVKLVDVNAAAVETYRLRSKEEVFAAYQADMNYGATADMRAVFLQFLRAFAAGDTRAVADAVDRAGDGVQIDVRVHARLMPDGLDTWRRVLVLIEDITDQKKSELDLREANERLRAAMEQLSAAERFATIGQVAATVSHEIRNPLGAISGSLALVRQLTSNGDARVGRALDRIDRNVERCGAVISDLLEFSAKRDVRRKPVWIDAWLKEILSHIRLPTEIVLEQELHANDEVAIDSDRLRQAINNVVQNAVQALSSSGPNSRREYPKRIAVRAESVDTHVRVSISDTGPGIPSDVLPHIFEPLFTTKSFGVGLGLSIARQIVEQHHGRIDVMTSAHNGTTVTLQIPHRQS